MKRKNLLLDADLLERATKIRGLASFYGQGLWAGDLAEVREDRPPPKTSKHKKSQAR